MADGLREVVNDPLALNPREREQQNSLPTYGVRNPGQRAGDAVSRRSLSALNVLDGISASIGRIAEAKQEDAIINGQLSWMRGGVESELAKNGDKYTKQGWQSMESVNSATQWFQSELQFQQSEEGMSMDPAAYQERLMKSRSDALANLPNDPAVKKMWTAAFKDYGPRLMASQTETHNKYNETRGGAELYNMILGTGPSSADSSVRVSDDGFRINQEPVAEAWNGNANDRDIVIRTMLGEAGAEGSQGMAAVAHVILNRARDGRWPKSLQDVALQDKQFSAWNEGAGGNNPLKYSDTSAAYIRAGEIYDAVVSGHHVDPTNGATHYYSPKGMDALVNEGSQSNRVPSWLDQQRAESGGEVRLGNHIFVGKSKAGGPAGYKDPVVSAQGSQVQYEQNGDGTPEQVAQAEGIPIGQQSQRPRGTQLMRLIMNSPYKAETKADALSKAMIRSLDEGDDSIFNDAGGVAVLSGLGANASQIDAVHKAKQRFDDKQDKDFDLEFERGRADILQQAQDGMFASENDMWLAVDNFSKKYSNRPAEAKSLARQVAAEYNKSGSDIVPLELRNLGAQLKDGVDSGLYTPEEAGQKVIDYKKANPGVKDAVVNNFIADLYSRAESNKDKMKSDLRTALKKQADEQATIGRVQQSLVAGTGLKGADGRMSIPDEANPNRKIEVSAEEGGIWLLKQNTATNLQKALAAGDITKEQYEVKYYNDIYENLAKQGVYDTKFGQQVASAVTGDVIGPDKQPTDQSMQALSFYMQMRDNPRVGADYLAGMIPNQRAREFLEVAASLYDGQNDISTSILRASTIMNNKVDHAQKLEKNGVFYGQVDKAVNSAVGRITQTDGFWNKLTNTDFTSSDIKTIQSNDARMNAYVSRQAEFYHLQNPNIDSEVAVKMAADDLARDSVVVGNDVIIGSEARGTRLDQTMGLTTFGRNGPHQAINDYLSEFGETQWGQLWTNATALRSDPNAKPVGNLISVQPLTAKPDYGVTYDQSQGILEIVLYKDSKRSETVGEPLYLDAKTLGDRYKKKIETGKASAVSTYWRDFVDTVTDRRQAQDAARVGAEIGSMINR